MLSVIGAICFVPIAAAPFGLVLLFSPEEQGYAVTVPLFIPAIGLKVLFQYFNSENTDPSIPDDDLTIRTDKLEGMTLIIAVVGTISAVSALILMQKIEFDVKTINENKKPRSKRLNTYMKFADSSYLIE